MSTKRKTATGISRGGPSHSCMLGGNSSEGSLRTFSLQGGSDHRSLADQYREAARRNAEAGRDLGGQQGFALISLAEHFARRAHLHAIAAGGVR